MDNELGISPLSRGIQNALAMFGAIQRVRNQALELEREKQRDAIYAEDRQRARDAEELRTRISLNASGARPVTEGDRFEAESGSRLTTGMPVIRPDGRMDVLGNGGQLIAQQPSDIAGRMLNVPGSSAPWVLPSQDERDAVTERALQRKGRLDAEQARVRAEAEAAGRRSVEDARRIPLGPTLGGRLGQSPDTRVAPETLDDLMRAEAAGRRRVVQVLQGDDGRATAFWSDGTTTVVENAARTKALERPGSGSAKSGGSGAKVGIPPATANSIERRKEMRLLKAERDFTKARKDAELLGDQQGVSEAQEKLRQDKQAAQDAYEDELSRYGVAVEHVEYGPVTAGPAAKPTASPAAQPKKRATADQLRAYAKANRVSYEQAVKDAKADGYEVP